MLKRVQLLVLLSTFAGSASAADVSLVIDKQLREEIKIGGLFSLFRMKSDIKQTWLEMRPQRGDVLIESVSLDSGKCTFDSVKLPVLVSSNQKLEILPNCDVTQAEIETDRGTYRFRFD